MRFPFILRPIFVFIICISSVVASDRQILIVSIPPMQFLMQRLVGDEVEVVSLIGGSDNAELYEPTQSQLRMINRANLYFPVGLPFEKKWIPVIRENNPALVITECCDDLMQTFAKEKDHKHKLDRDPHIWMDPVINRVIVQRMRDALKAIFPAHEQDIFKNYMKLDKELVAVDEEIQSLTKNLKNKMFIVSHPAWTYFSERYGLVQVPLEHEGKEVGIRTTIRLAKLAKEKKIRAVFVQRQIKSSAAIAFAKEINAKIIQLDPLAYEHLENLRLNAKLITDSMRN